MSHARFQKQQREKAQRDKARAKVARREERRASVEDEPSPAGQSDEATVLADLAELHRKFEAEEISFDDFAAAKDDLTQQLHVQ
jgi:hypothetical protein